MKRVITGLQGISTDIKGIDVNLKALNELLEFALNIEIFPKVFKNPEENFEIKTGRAFFEIADRMDYEFFADLMRYFPQVAKIEVVTGYECELCGAQFEQNHRDCPECYIDSEWDHQDD